jgi:hypothetical protein
VTVASRRAQAVADARFEMYVGLCSGSMLEA